MKRWALYRFSPWLTFWAVSILGGLWLFTEPGLQWLWMMARPQLPSALVVGEVRGSLLEGIEIENLQWNDDQLLLRLRSAKFNWELRNLLQAKIEIDPLKLRGLSIQQRSSIDSQPEEKQTPSETIKLPKLPRISLPDIDLADFSFRNGESSNFQIERLRARAEHVDGQLSFQLLEFRQEEKPIVVGRLAAQLGESTLQLKTLALGPSQGGQIRVQGQLNFANDLGAEMRFFVEEFNPAPWIENEQWQKEFSAIQGSGHISFQQDKTKGLMALTVHEAALNSYWQKHIFSLQGSALTWSGDTLDIGKVKLESGSATLSAFGRLDLEESSRNKIEMSAKIGDLVDILPQSTGQIELSATLKGQLTKPRIRFNGQVSNLGVGSLELEHGTWKGNLSANPNSSNDWALRAQGLAVGNIALDDITIGVSGPMKSTKVQLSALGSDIHLNSRVDLNLSDTLKPQIYVRDLAASYTAKENWELVSSQGAIRRERNAWILPEHCFSDSFDTSLCANYQYEKGNSRGQLEVKNLAFSKLLTWANDPSLKGQGHLGLIAKIEPQDGTGLGRIHGTLETSAIKLSRHDPSAAIPLLDFEPGKARWDYSADGVVADVQLDAKDGGHLNFELKTSATWDIETAKGELLVNDLTALSLISAEVLESQGQLTANWEAQGNLLNNPNSRFEANLRDGRFRINTPQIELKPVNLRLTGGSEKALLTGGLNSGKGRITVAGIYRFAEQQGEIHLNGEDFEVVNSALAQVRISPEIQAIVQGKRVDVKGKVRIPYADIHPDKLPKAGSDYIAPNTDQVLLFEQSSSSPQKASGAQIFSQLRVELGDKVKFSGFGLNTEIAGAIDVKVEPGKKPLGNGNLTLKNGRYKAYGQDLTLERGRVLFSGGPVDEPGVDIRAYRKPSSSVTVGIQIRGSARQPEISLWSDPAMDQTEQLSWLVLGRSGQANSAEDETSLQNATLALGLKGSDFLAKRVKGKLGLDEVSIGTRPGDQSNQAALVLGKYLNPRIYVSYGIGLFEPVYTFRMRYSISEKWTVQTESGIESSGDIVYTIER